jgi:hypothetical protein
MLRRKDSKNSRKNTQKTQKIFCSLAAEILFTISLRLSRVNFLFDKLPRREFGGRYYCN